MLPRLLLILGVVALPLLLVACGGDDDDDDAAPGAPSTATPFPNDPGHSPQIEMPASRFSISQEDLGPGYVTQITHTWNLNSDNYGRTGTFASAAEGWRLLNEWGYLGGYETGYTPEGGTRAVLQGAYNIAVETHLFESEEGAILAYDYIEKRLADSVSAPVSAYDVGNQSSAWVAVDSQEGIGGSSVAGEYHRYVFRRGNLVAVVLTWGAEPFMDVTPVYQLAHVIDSKATGEREAVEPTPVSLAAGS